MGKPLFDGTVRYAVQGEMANSSFVSVFPRPRVEDILRLMEKPLDSPTEAGLSAISH
jgi:hypothetical protein